MTQRTRLFFPLMLALLAGFSACISSHNHTKKNVHINSVPLVIQPAEMDMGEVMEGHDVRATLFLRNTGPLPVHIEKVESSCGCTTASPDTRELAPGEFTPLHIRVDTTAKRGHVKKNIAVFDSQGRKTQAWLTLMVQANPHMGAMKGKGIFDGKCGACHAEPARGKVRGNAIYKAVCAMCHGGKAEGAYAPLLRGRRATSISSVLMHGLGRKMPSFSREKKGPLSHAQIASVAKWLSELDEQAP